LFFFCLFSATRWRGCPAVYSVVALFLLSSRIALLKSFARPVDVVAEFVRIRLAQPPNSHEFGYNANVFNRVFMPRSGTLKP